MYTRISFTFTSYTYKFVGISTHGEVVEDASQDDNKHHNIRWDASQDDNKHHNIIHAQRKHHQVTHSVAGADTVKTHVCLIHAS